MMQISGKCKNAPAFPADLQDLEYKGKRYIQDAPSKSVKNAGEYF